ncbi:MAG: DUF6788 family protein [Acidimicrobiales bacterium]
MTERPHTQHGVGELEECVAAPGAELGEEGTAERHKGLTRVSPPRGVWAIRHILDLERYRSRSEVVDPRLWEDGAMANMSTKKRLARLRRRYDALLNEIGEIGYIASGSLAQRYNRCGKPNCRCHADPPRLQGPYWHWTATQNGKTVNRRFTDEQAEIYKQWIANDRRLRSLTAELRTVAHEATEILLADSRHSGVKV